MLVIVWLRSAWCLADNMNRAARTTPRTVTPTTGHLSCTRQTQSTGNQPAASIGETRQGAERAPPPSDDTACALVSGVVGQIVRCARKLIAIIDRLDPHD